MQRVLIVDDIPENLYLLEVLLKGNGFEAVQAANGAEALESARSIPPDLVISDILMPVMDGYALCREWRNDERLKAIPFIFYTATFTEKQDEALALSLGANRFLVKPLEPESLMTHVRQVLADAPLTEVAASPDILPDETGLLKEYNEALFRKLEKKMGDLEQANRELTQTMSEQKRLEEQLRQAQKLEAIGRFSAGIAHDFNNLLTVIFGFGAIMQMQMADGDPQRERLNRILAAADLAKNLTRSLLTFSRKQEMELKRLNLNECIRNTVTFLQRIIGDDIKLAISLYEEGLPILADGGHIEQVLMNLATNARDAMPSGGMLSIGTEKVIFDDAFIQMHGFGSPGPHAVITFSDDGIGMDEATRLLIFEPFFTTKETGKGTGLGLSIIYGIIKQHLGHISVYSEPGQGTTFRIFLPLVDVDDAQLDADVGQATLRGGQETILVVDDETAIREYLKEFLHNLGYTVLLAGDGQQAVDLLRTRGHEVNLVLLDVIMPNKKGNEALHEIRRIRSDIKVLFTSGYPLEYLREHNLLVDGVRTLMKPLNPIDLANMIRVTLDD